MTTVGNCKSACDLEAGDIVDGREVEDVDVHADGTVSVCYVPRRFAIEADAETFRRLELVPVE